MRKGVRKEFQLSKYQPDSHTDTYDEAEAQERGLEASDRLLEARCFALITGYC